MADGVGDRRNGWIGGSSPWFGKPKALRERRGQGESTVGYCMARGGGQRGGPCVSAFAPDVGFEIDVNQIGN